jgi:CelD/BcsL family acetyltransferase involved in cellulose biosynthesis
MVEVAAMQRLVPAWRDLAERSAVSPFQSPDWLLPWLRHYGSMWQPRIVSWWRRSDLVGLAPVAWRRRGGRGLTVRELSFWGWTGTPIRGWVDVVADAGSADEVAADFAAWLEHPDQPWDLFHYLHLPADSPTLAALATPSSRWANVDLSLALHSLEYVVPLPDDVSGWPGQLGPKARHEIRREVRLFERRLGGRIEHVADPAASDEVVAALGSLMADRWGDREAYFQRDPRFTSFVCDVAREAFDSGHGWALVARDPRRAAACLVMLALNRTAVATLLGVSREERYRAMSLGKCLFDRALHDAGERGYRTFSFLTENGYKTAYWHALGRPTNSGFLARGPLGRAVAAWVTARRIVPQRVRDRAAGRPRLDYRP